MTDIEVLLTTMIQSPSAWYAQSKKELFADHDLPRSFVLKMPMSSQWSNRTKGRLEVPGGRIMLNPIQVKQDWQLVLTAELVDPPAFMNADKSGILARILKHLRGAK